MTSPLDSPYENFILKGESQLRARNNIGAVHSFDDAITCAQHAWQLSSAYYAKAKVHHVLGELNEAEPAYVLALLYAAADFTAAKILYDIAYLYLDKAEWIPIEPQYDGVRESSYTEAEAAFRHSFKMLGEAAYSDERAIVVSGFGRLNILRGNTDMGLRQLDQADMGIKHHASYKLNNLIWMMIVSPVARWFYGVDALRLAVAHRSNRNHETVGRVLAAFKGRSYYEEHQRQKSRL